MDRILKTQARPIMTRGLSLLRHTNSLSTPSGGLGVLSADTQAPVVTQTTVVPGEQGFFFVTRQS
jgi:hypothetical protein